MPKTQHVKKEPIAQYARRALAVRRQQLLDRRATDEAGEETLLAEREPDWEDRAADVAAAGNLHRLSDRDLIQLKRVMDALERLDAGTYGRCQICGKPIEEARLRAVPEAPRCGGCTNHE